MSKPYRMYGEWYCNGIQFSSEEEAWEYYREENNNGK